MALTASEEALVQQLLDQQAAILSLAGNEATITSKLGATKVTLADLVAANAVADADLLLMRQGTNDKSVTAKKLADYIALQVGIPTAVAGGTADAITADFTPNVALTNGTTVIVRASAANTTTTPTFAPDGLTAKTIVKGNNLALVAGDIAGAGHWLVMNFDTVLDKWVLQNPADVATTAQAQALSDNWNKITPLRLKEAFQGANQSLSGNGYQKLPGGLIMQWGSISTSATSGTVTFPTTFPNACFSVVAHDYATSASDNSIVRFNSPTNTYVSWLAQTYTGSSVSPTGWTWIAIGY